MKALSAAIFLLYFASLIYPDVERYVYNNEFFSLLGLIVIMIPALTRGKLTRTLTPLFALIVYGLVLLIFSIPQIVETGLYLSLRTMPILYSIFAFFLGMFCLNQFSTGQIIKITRKMRWVSWAGLFISPFRLTPQVLLSLTLGGAAAPFFLFMIVFWGVRPGATTVTGLMLGAAFFFWINLSKAKMVVGKKMIIAASFSLFLSIYLMKPVLDRFLVIGYDGVGGDNNATWRLMFWVYLFNEKFLQSPVYGLGFGAPLFDLTVAPEFITSDDGSRFTEYTLGTHNSFFYTGIRMGSIGLLLLLWSTLNIYSHAVKQIKKIENPREKGVLVSLVLANLMFLNSAFFNVVLESPLYAANYWFTLGLMYAFARKSEAGAH